MFITLLTLINCIKTSKKTLFFEGAQKGLPDGLQSGGQKWSFLTYKNVVFVIACIVYISSITYNATYDSLNV